MTLFSSIESSSCARGRKGDQTGLAPATERKRQDHIFSEERKTSALHCKCAALPCGCLVSAWVPPLGSSPQAEIFSPWFLAVKSVHLLTRFVTASGQENESGYEENFIAVEGPGPGGDQHCCAVQLPGT